MVPDPGQVDLSRVQPYNQVLSHGGSRSPRAPWLMADAGKETGKPLAQLSCTHQLLAPF